MPGLTHLTHLDAAHIIRNRKSKTFSAIKAINSRHRWCITGTPIQNSLEDLASLVEFLHVHPFDSPDSFRDTFMASGKYWERLKSLIQCIAIRRTKATIEQEINLPQRREIVQLVHLDSDERQIYDLIKRHFALSIDSGGSTMNAFSLILRLRQVCNHGRDLLPAHLQRWIDQARLFSDQTLPNPASCEVCNNIPVLKGRELMILPCLHQLCQTCIKWDDRGDKEKSAICPLCEGSLPRVFEQSFDSVRSDSHSQYNPSSKVRALIKNLNIDRKEAVQSKTLTAKR